MHLLKPLGLEIKMSLFTRLFIRIREEGLIKTFKYIICAFSYCLREIVYDFIIDLVCSRSFLNGNIKTSYKWLGSNDIYHSKYSVLPKIFKLAKIKKEDVLVDIGCGKGRVINYWLFKRYQNKIIGLELDQKIARQTAKQFSRVDRVTIMPGNALFHIPDDGTFFYFYNPFSFEVVSELEKILSDRFKNKPIRIIYYNPKSIEVFKNGKWKIKYFNFDSDLGYKKWGRINKYHDLAIIKNVITKKNI
jgi:SAM-dependent methyltransferase